MRIYLSGWQASKPEREAAVVKSGYLKHRCFSFAMIQRLPGLPYYLPNLEGSYQECLKGGVGIMMDSGVVSWRSYRTTCTATNNQKALSKLLGEKEFIQQYVDYVKANQQNWDFYMTIDLERNAKNIFERHFKIEAMGIRPVPVFHGDDSVEYLKKYADKGHKLVSIASWRTIRTEKKQFRQYFDAVFNLAAKCNLQIHGLAMTAPWMMVSYPWYSVDSSSWSRVAGYGGIMEFDEHRERMSTLHVSERASSGKGSDFKLNVKAMQRVKEMVEAEGFDFHKLQTDFVDRHVWNAKTMQKMADYATNKYKSGGWNLLF